MARYSRLGIVAFVALLALTAFAVTAELWKVLVISWAGFSVMAIGAVLGDRTATASGGLLPAWGYGLASGAMIISAALFLVPQAIGHHPKFGGLGIGLGILSGYMAHTVGHRLTHVDLPLELTSAEIAAHALAAGSIIGLVYGNADLGVLLGLAIASHKGPAGYAVIQRLQRQDLPGSAVLVPASAFGVAAIALATLNIPPNPVINGLVFGFGAGIFLHVAMDFTPRCEVGGEVFEVASLSVDAHAMLDRLRLHVISSMVTGAAVVVVLWLAAV